MTVLTKVGEYFKRRRLLKETRDRFFYSGLEYFERHKNVSEETNVAVIKMQAAADALTKYLMQATMESEVNRKVIEAKVKRDEDNSPSPFDDKY